MIKLRFWAILGALAAILCLSYAQQKKVIVSYPGDSYTVDYDTQLLCPKEVRWTLHASDIGHTPRLSSWRFLTDDWLIPYGVNHYDFSRSGYDRGHMCPAQDRSLSKDSMISTFFMSNVAAQAPKLNRGAWFQTEAECRNLATQFDSIRVVAMPLFLRNDTVRIGRSGVAVPDAFIKFAYLLNRDTLLMIRFLWNR